MSDKLLSIIVVSYNNFKYYKQCLDSIFIQGYKNIELIFSDDGSVNFPKEEIEEYIYINKGENIVNVIVNYNEKNIGTVKNLNKAIKMSKGDYIQSLAVDDTFYEEATLSKLVDYLDREDALFCFGYVDVYDESLQIKLKRNPSLDEVNIIKNGDSKEIHKMLCISGGFIPAPSRIYSKKFFEKYGLYNEEYKLLEDKATLAKAIREGCKIHFTDEIIAKYRDGGISRAGSINPHLKKDRETFNQKEVFPYWGISLKDLNKDYVIWGTSTKYLDNRDRLLQANFKYFVDSDVNKQGTTTDERIIHSPIKLLEEDKEKVVIIICSAFHIEISSWLEENGFEENKNYININFTKEL